MQHSYDFRGRLLRAPDGEGAAGASPGAPGASGETPPGAPATPPGAAPAAPGGTTPPASWYSPFNLEKDHADYIDQRRYDGLPALVRATMNFDTLARGRNVIEKPDPKKPAEWKGYSELGYIDDPAKYAAAVVKPVPSNGQPPVNEAVFNEVVKAAHAAKLAPWQTQALYQAVYSFAVEQEKGAEATADREESELKAALQKEWGADAQHNTELASRALRTLAPDEETANELETIIGSPRLVKFFHKLGTMLGEDQLMVTGTPALASDNPSTIERQLRELETDTDKRRALSDQRHPLHRDVVAQRRKLIERLAQAQNRAGR